MGFSLGSAFSGVGSVLNGITGVTSSSNQAFRQNMALANLSNAYSKEFAQNAHQWEMNDLQKAGLNPALTATGSSAGAVAGAGGNGNSGSVGTSAMSPIDIVSALNQTSATKHNNSLQDNQGKFAKAQAIARIEMLPLNKQEKQSLIDKLDAETKYTNERARGFSHTDTWDDTDSESNETGTNIDLGGSVGKKIFGGVGANVGGGKKNAHSKTTHRGRTISDTW